MGPGAKCFRLFLLCLYLSCQSAFREYVWHAAGARYRIPSFTSCFVWMVNNGCGNVK